MHNYTSGRDIYFGNSALVIDYHPSIFPNNERKLLLTACTLAKLPVIMSHNAAHVA